MREEINVVDEVKRSSLREGMGPKRSSSRVPPELRRTRVNFSLEAVWYKRIISRLRQDSQFLRSGVQLAFALLCLWIGIEFYLFMEWGMNGGAGIFFSRPPGVEGFLPISALISAKYWLQASAINTIHPATLFIFLAIVLVSVVLKKSFCGWLCPIGTLSESLWLLGERIFGKNIHLPRWLDYPLRSIKYLLLLFFLWAVSGMNLPALEAFISSPYNKMADVKMYLFFANISAFGLWVIMALMMLSMVVKNFWCRFLCPYGALLGVLSWLSPFKITREASSCIDCELCTKACPSNILVHKSGRVWSDECTSCMRCVEVCPVRDTLSLRTRLTKKTVPNWACGVLVAGVFIAVTGMAMLTDHWKNSISQTEYLQRFHDIESPLYQH